MKAVIVGGGKIGYFLAQTLDEKGYRVVVVEKCEKECLKLADELNIEVICGDGTDLEVLHDAGMNHANVVAAVTGLDEENLVICQIAKLNYKIEKTIARVNNPKNKIMFQKLGVDKTVCSTQVIANLIEYELDTTNYKILQTFERGSMILVEVEILSDHLWKDMFVSELYLPKDCVISSIIREGNVIFPRGNTRIQQDDQVLVLTNHQGLTSLKKQISGRIRK